MEVSICAATFGHRDWIDLAHGRAVPSAYAQDVPVVYRHEDTLADARNAAVRAADTEWVIVLDADDELEAGYVKAMAAGTADIRAPRLVEVYEDGSRTEVPLAHRNIENLNPLPVSSMARRDDILAAGGFARGRRGGLALWLRMVRRGATFEHLSGATLFAHVRGTAGTAP